ncbi:phosphatase PAP2 family protein [Nocardioides mesophilus]|uniref:Phosphatase PAP2 family protein n=1 Tax=Nocardioides mesophilus TaxID=433659 RepID=A0A7G9R7C6_9ACTN|nr:phosphatase PAP2 family protein [Nocardioides mesophilus]QNN51501.1 phosphatase PAP2 family protein [Nocardioides mesophilus]
MSSARLRLVAVLVVLGSAALLLSWVTTLDQPPRADVAVHDLLWAHRDPAWTRLAGLVTWVGSIRTLVPLLVLVLLVRPRTSRPVLHAGWVLGFFGLAVLTRSVLQPALGRPRPPTDGILADGPGSSFPSGHTLQIVVALGLLLACYRPAGRGARTLATVAALAVVSLVGLSRLYLGVHWLTDVAGGALLGAGVLVLWWATGPWRPGPAGPQPREQPEDPARRRGVSR